MTFPVYFHILGFSLHAHMVMEFVAYSCGFHLYRVLRRKWHIKHAPAEQMIWIIIAGLFGALAGSKLVAWAESFHLFWSHRFDPRVLISGKTIVGGLGGAWLGIELAKRQLGVRTRTGDVFVFPLIVAISIGRVGCFLTGLEDQTCGTPTSLPWGVDFGDGIPRHPTQLYEIAFLLCLGVILLIRMRRPYVNGSLFRSFIGAYFAWRFIIDFIKPHDPADLLLGIGAIQMVSLVGFLIAVRGLYRPGDADLFATMEATPPPTLPVSPTNTSNLCSNLPGKLAGNLAADLSVRLAGDGSEAGISPNR